jgi:hypothetical protein
MNLKAHWRYCAASGSRGMLASDNAPESAMTQTGSNPGIDLVHYVVCPCQFLEGSAFQHVFPSLKFEISGLK